MGYEVLQKIGFTISAAKTRNRGFLALSVKPPEQGCQDRVYVEAVNNIWRGFKDNKSEGSGSRPAFDRNKRICGDRIVSARYTNKM